MIEPDVGERRDDRQPRPDDDVDVAGADPPPFVGPLAVAETRMEQRDPRVEVRPQPIDERQRQGDLGDEDEGRPAGFERRRDRLDVDRRLAAAGDAVEEERPRIARRRSRRVTRATASAWAGSRSLLGGRPPRRPGGPGGQRPAGTLADVGDGETAADEPGQRRGPVASRRAPQPGARPRACRPARRVPRPGADRAAVPPACRPAASAAATARPSSVRRIQRS